MLGVDWISFDNGKIIFIISYFTIKLNEIITYKISKQNIKYNKMKKYFINERINVKTLKCDFILFYFFLFEDYN